MKHEETKERLNNKTIAKDAAWVLFDPYFWFLFLVVGILAAFIMFWDFLQEGSVAAMWIEGSTLFLVGLLLLGIAMQVWNYIQICRGNFRVIRAPLIKMVEVDDNPFDHRKGPYLDFGSKGKYTLPRLPLYQWSRYYKVTAKELWDRSCNGDEFYLIKRHKRPILTVYPTRCFLWQGEEHKQ